jgi:hypothetical protein
MICGKRKENCKVAAAEIPVEDLDLLGDTSASPAS